MEDIPFLHVHSPLFHHSTGQIIASKSALKKLKDVIDNALKEQISEDSFYGYDGEEYNLKVIAYNGEKNDLLATPYQDSSAKESRPDAIWPKELADLIKGRHDN